MNTPYTAVPSFSHSLEQNPDAKDLTIYLKTQVFQPWSASGSPLSFELSFSPEEFIHEDDESPGKEELSYFLIESGIEGFDAQFMITDLILLACDVTNSVDSGFKGVLSLTLTVRFVPADGFNRSGSRKNPGGEVRERFFTPVELKPVSAKSGEPAVKSRDGWRF